MWWLRFADWWKRECIRRSCFKKICRVLEHRKKLPLAAFISKICTGEKNDEKNYGKNSSRFIGGDYAGSKFADKLCICVKRSRK